MISKSITHNSIGGINLNDSIESIKNIWIEAFKNRMITKESIQDFFLRITISNSIIININLLENKICQISALNKYTGRFFQEIGIGSTISELKKKFPNILYEEDENYYYIPEYNNVAFFLKSPYELLEDNPLNKIEEITINVPQLLIYPN